jgi:Tfp pilus assembly protein PilN
VTTINLLPKEEKKRDVRGLLLNVLMVIVVILFLATILITYFMFDIDNMLSTRLSEYESVNIKTKDMVNKLKVYSDFKKGVDEKSAVLEELKKNKLIWSGVLYDIGRLMPEDCYILSFEAKGSDLYTYIEDYRTGDAEQGTQVVSFTLYGQAASYMDVLKLNIELKKIENIEVVWIENISKTVVPEMDLEVITFIINTYWNLDTFTEDIEKTVKSQDEGVLDEDITEI